MAFVALSLFLLPAVLAQSQSNSGISQACNNYLDTFNNNTAFAACTSPFVTALQQFAPGGSTSPTAATVTTALNSLCSSSAFNACPHNTVTTQLSSFYAACEAELTSAPVESVKQVYDSLFVLIPLRLAVCAKDDSGNYCATQLSNSSSPAGSVAIVDPEKSNKQALLGNYLYTSGSSTPTRRDLSNTTALAPNTTTYSNTNLLFMFLEPSMPSSLLCTTCTRNIISPYITFESNCTYAPGMNNTLLLAGQVSLYNGITNKCGANFLGSTVQSAGGLSGGIVNVSPAASLAVGHELSAAVAAILGVAAFVAASF